MAPLYWLSESLDFVTTSKPNQFISLCQDDNGQRAVELNESRHIMLKLLEKFSISCHIDFDNNLPLEVLHNDPSIN